MGSPLQRLTSDELKRAQGTRRSSRNPSRARSADDYGRFASLADLFRQIGYDERVHKPESLERVATAGFR